MKLMRCNSSTGNASWAVGYLLRREETGIIWTTDILQDEASEAAIKQLQADQKEAFYGGKMRMSLDLQDRRKKLLDSASENFQFCGTRAVRNLAKLVHDMDLTMMFNREGSHFKMLTEPIPLPDADDSEAVEKILKSVEAVRDLFPKNLPGIFTIHTKGDKTPISIEEAVRLRKNIHIQALLATKTFENGTWSSPYQPLSPKKGDDHLIAELAERVEKAVTDVIGRSFKKHTEVVVDENGGRTRVAIDPNRPVRTTYSSAAAAIIGRHTNQQLRNLPLESIKDVFVRQEIRQVLAIDVYDRKLHEELFQPKLTDMFNELLATIGGNFTSIKAIQPKPATFSALIADYEERRDYAAVVKQHTTIQPITEKLQQNQVGMSLTKRVRPLAQRSQEDRDTEMLKKAIEKVESQRIQQKQAFKTFSR